ncbi:hypothetical protein ACE14D_23135, partial [Streptomyces sp. Act-28]
MRPSTGTRGETVPTVPPANPAVDAAEVAALLDRGRTLSTPVLRAAVERLAKPMDTVAAYHFGWIDALGRPADGDGGKAVRPALALLSAEAARPPPGTRGPGARARGRGHQKKRPPPRPRRPPAHPPPPPPAPAPPPPPPPP